MNRVTEEQLEVVAAAWRRERLYQDAKWGTVVDHPHDLAGWFFILRRETAEAVDGWITKGGDTEALRELLQVLAVIDAVVQQYRSSQGVTLQQRLSNIFLQSHHNFPALRYAQSVPQVLARLEQELHGMILEFDFSVIDDDIHEGMVSAFCSSLFRIAANLVICFVEHGIFERTYPDVVLQHPDFK